MAAGSPPRMRGKLFNKIREAMPPGITPADAGKTILQPCFVFFAQDHPRGCGENREKQEPMRREIGSPPRMRGKQSSALAPGFGTRITPADAGKTRCWKPNLTATRDHPRGCGENLISKNAVKARKGSPPRMRGKHSSKVFSTLSCRFTPADAGKTITTSNVLN